MRTRSHTGSNPFSPALARRCVLACLTLTTAGCASIVGSIVGTVTGEEVTLVEDPGPTVPRSEYLRGPVPGWEYQSIRWAPYRLPPSLFQVDLFAGACPGLRLAGVAPAGAFSAVHVEADFQFIEFTASHVADPHSYRFGQVAPAGVPDPLPPCAFSRMLAQADGACTSVGIPLLSLGRPVRYAVHR